jgi:arylsulfatase A-like enzyme
MKRRQFVKSAALCACTGISAMKTAESTIRVRDNNTDKPNIVLLYADDMGMGDLSCYHHAEYATPYIDSIAADGIRCTQFYVSAPSCTPSRFSLLTGMLPNRSEDQLRTALMFAQEKDERRGLRSSETTIAQLVQSVGYKTAIFGKWHLGHGDSQFLPIHHGFDTFVGHTGGCIDYYNLSYGNIPDWYHGEAQGSDEGYATDIIAEKACQWMAENVESPFFLYVPFNAPHYAKAWDNENGAFLNTLQAPQAIQDRFSHIRDEKRRLYAAMVYCLDQAVGKILSAIQALGLEENTMVFFISDNGADPNYGGSNRPFRGKKSTYFEGGIRVPALIKYPGRIPKSSLCSQAASTLDILPTLSSMLHFSLPAQPQDGIDISQALFEGTVRDRELFYDDRIWGRVLRQGRWKWQMLGKEGATPAEDGLFDMETDALEENNLKDVYPDRYEAMRKRHEELRRERGSR